MVGISETYWTLNRNLTGLCAFDVVARHGNFTSAAEALGLTQSAMSQRIKNLEIELGVTLFRREHRGVELTNDGRRLLAVIRPAMSRMSGSVSSLVQRKSKPRVRLSLDFAFATFWLLPRLPRLRAELVEIDIQLLTSQTPVEAAGDDCDLIIHMCNTNNIGEADALLLKEKVVAVCSPDFMSAHGPVENPSQLLNLPLLSLSGPQSAPWHTWQSWFDALDVDGVRTRNFTSFNNYDLIVQAAVHGQGVALGWLGLIDSLLENQSLITITDGVVSSERGYAITQTYSSDSKWLRQVFDWIVDQRHQ